MFPAVWRLVLAGCLLVMRVTPLAAFSSRLRMRWELAHALRTAPCGRSVEYDVENITELIYSPSLPPKTFPFFTLAPSEQYSRPINVLGRSWLGIVETPHIKHEGWRHMRVVTLFGARSSQREPSPVSDIENLIHADAKGSVLVFVDGTYSEALSNTTNVPVGVQVRVLDAAEPLPPRLQERLLRPIDREEHARNSYCSDALSAINLALTSQILTIHADARTHMVQPLQLLFIATGNASAFPRVHLEMQNQSALQLLQSIHGMGNDAVACGITHLTLHANSSLRHTYFQVAQRSDRHVEVVDAQVDTGAELQLFALQLGGRVSRINAHVDLRQEGASVQVHGLAMGVRGQCLDLHTSIQHQHPLTTARQQQRLVLGDHCHAVFKGRIRMPSIAQDCHAEQMCRTLLLGNHVKLHIMPTLEISADRVTCGHGVTVTELDENSLFYLAARGLDRKRAKHMLMRSFAMETMEGAALDLNMREQLIQRMMTLVRDGANVTSSKQFMMSI